MPAPILSQITKLQQNYRWPLSVLQGKMVLGSTAIRAIRSLTLDRNKTQNVMVAMMWGSKQQEKSNQHRENSRLTAINIWFRRDRLVGGRKKEKKSVSGIVQCDVVMEKTDIVCKVSRR